MSQVVTNAIATRRLGAAPTAYPLSFTVDRAEALQRQRHRPGAGRWSWTLQVLRALFSLTDGARFVVAPSRGHAVAGVRLCFSFDATPLAGIAPQKLLDAALEPDAGPGDGSLATRQRRFVRLLARGINESLAFGPCRVNVRIARRMHRFTIGDCGVGEAETIEEVPPSTEVDTWPLEIEVMIDRFVGRWFEIAVGRDCFRETLQLWFARVPGIDLSVTPGVLRPVPVEPPVRLGALGAWWPQDSKTIALLRDGVVLGAALGRGLAEHGVPVRDFVGVIEAPQLRLTYDEASVIVDAEVNRLVAWLGDVHAHASRLPIPLTSEQLISYGTQADRYRRYEGRIVGASWPDEPGWVPTVDGRWVAIEELRGLAAEHREIPFCWTHERATTPEHLRSHTLMLWPRELDALARIPGLRLVPVAALHVGSISDWGALVQVSFPELALGAIARSRDIPVRIEVNALVHRRAEATQGRIELASRGAVVAEIREPSRVLPGVLLVGRVAADDPRTPGLGPAELQAALAAIEQHARARVDVLAAHARKHSTRIDDDAPLLRAIAMLGESVLAAPAIDVAAASVSSKAPSLLVDVALRDHAGSLHLRPLDEAGVVEVWREGRRQGTHVLPPPWARVGGSLGVRTAGVAVDLATVMRVVERVLAPEVRRVWPLTSPKSELHRELVDVATTVPSDTFATMPEIREAARDGTEVREALAIILDEPDLRTEAVLWWTPAARGTTGVVSLGVLNFWMQGALVDPSPAKVPLATVLALAMLLEDDRALEVAIGRALALFTRPR